MTADDYPQFVALWQATHDLYPGRAPTDDAIDLAFAALEHYPIGDVRTALSVHVRDPDVGQYAPKPADIVRRISGSGTDHSTAAWSKVERAIRSVGQYQSVTFDDPAIHATIVDIGGWVRLCNTSEDELPFTRQHFAKRFDAYRRQGGPREYPGRLAGIAEGDNRANGFPNDVPEPVMVGHEPDARRVLEQGAAETRPALTYPTRDAHGPVMAISAELSRDGGDE